MGFLDRTISVVNRVARPLQNATTPVDPRLARGAKLEQRGREATGTIVGIARTYHDEATRTTFALEVADPDGSAPQRFGTEITTTAHLHWLRLGVSVPVRVDGDRCVVDWPALATMLGLDGSAPGQRPRRTPPDEGIEERSRTPRELRRLREGRRTTSTLVRTERCHVLGLPSLNWDLHLRFGDGTTTVVAGDEVPAYAWWLAAPGAVLPVAVDHDDHTRATVDWAKAATDAATGPVPLSRRPPEGSIAASVVAEVPAATEVASTAIDPATLIAAHRDEAAVHGTLADWVAEVHAGRMKPKAFRKHVTEWEAAGLCTAQEAAAARAAAGIES